MIIVQPLRIGSNFTVLNDEMASLIALEFGFEPHVDKTAAFDLFPQYHHF